MKRSTRVRAESRTHNVVVTTGSGTAARAVPGLSVGGRRPPDGRRARHAAHVGPPLRRRPERAPGRARTAATPPADVARLERMRRLVIEGYPPAEAARAACAERTDDAAAPAPHEPARAGGGHVVPLPGATPAARGLARAAQSLDQRACSTIIGESLAARGVVWTWDHLVVPVLVRHRQAVAVRAGRASRSSTPSAARSRTRCRAPCAPCRIRPAIAPSSLPAHRASCTRWRCGRSRRRSPSGGSARGPRRQPADGVPRRGGTSARPGGGLLWAQVPGAVDPSVPSAVPTLRPAAAVLVGGPGLVGGRAGGRDEGLGPERHGGRDRPCTRRVALGSHRPE